MLRCSITPCAFLNIAWELWKLRVRTVSAVAMCSNSKTCIIGMYPLLSSKAASRIPNWKQNVSSLVVSMLQWRLGVLDGNKQRQVFWSVTPFSVTILPSVTRNRIVLTLPVHVHLSPRCQGVGYCCDVTSAYQDLSAPFFCRVTNPHQLHSYTNPAHLAPMILSWLDSFDDKDSIT